MKRLLFAQRVNSNEKGSFMKKKAAVLLTAAVLSGCAGPSTKVLPQRQSGTMQEVPDEVPVVEEVNSFYLQESLGILSASPRPSGSRGEDNAARYIQKLLKDYGYTVNRQRFREKSEHEEILGTNVVAMRPAEDPDADIILICTWHDSAPESPGAGNNASGVSVFLETARILSGIPTDTEVRFVSLSAHEKDALGARVYAKNLSKRERERLIGVITIGPCGAIDTEETVLATQDGKSTMLGDLLLESAAGITESRWSYIQKAGDENGIFASCAIPSVQVGQRYDSFDFGTPLDTVDTVDAECLSGIVDTLCQAVSKIMSLDTPSMRAKAHFENNWKEFTYTQESAKRIPFGVSPGKLQASLGIPGKLAVVTRNSAGQPVERYQFVMKWFGLDVPFYTSYYFTDEQLELVSLNPGENTLTADEMQEQLTELYGNPVKKITGPYGLDCIWQDSRTGEQAELTTGRDDYEIEIRSYTPQPVLMARYSADGVLEEGNIETGYEYLKGLGNVVFQPETAGLLSAALLYESDGIGGERIQAEKTEPVSGTAHAKDRKKADHPEQNDSENTKQWTIRIDPADFPEENGTFPDRAADLKVLLRTYGQMLKESMPEIYEAGYTELVQKNQQVPEQPDTAPGDTSQERSTAPEFEDAFALYVLADRPMDAPGIWQECVRYFDQFGELNTYRSAVRNYLGLQTEE